MFVAGDWSTSMFGILSLIIGRCSLKESPNVHKIDKIQCYCFISGYNVVQIGVHTVFLMLNLNSDAPVEAAKVEQGWKTQVALIGNFICLAFFIAGCYFS